MIFKRWSGIGFIGSSILVLSACIGDGDNSQQGGLTVHMAEVHVEEAEHDHIHEERSIRLDEGRLTAAIATTAASTAGGYDHANLEHHEIRDKNGRLLSIYRTYVVINNIELVSCPSLAQIPVMLMKALVPTAAAHAGHGNEPVGGRSLDAPNVIDIVTQDEYYLALGDIAAAPGRYCAARMSFVRLANIGYGVPEYEAASTDTPVTEPETPDMAGKIFAIRGDYCAAIDGTGACTQRIRVDVDDNGLIEPLAQTITFEQPLEVNARSPEVYVALGIVYGEWLSDVDITLLASDVDEQQKLLDNIARSVHIYDVGRGDLPVNTSL